VLDREEAEVEVRTQGVQVVIAEDEEVSRSHQSSTATGNGSK
jgi:hypothetical protein